MMKSIFVNNADKRMKDFKHNDNLNKLLNNLKVYLYPIQKKIENESNNKNYLPICFVLGCPRSGTTLFLQWLASLGYFAYPSNFLTRFAYSPYIGALIQEMLFNPLYDFNGDFNDIQSNINFSSNLGKSKGALGVNEFQHFFRNYMPNFDPEYLNGNDIKKVDFDGIEKGLNSLISVFKKPFVTKLMMLQFNLEEISQKIENAIYFYVKREPVYVMQSIYLARKKYYGDTNIWWSVKPKEYSWLKDMDVYHQIAGQVFFTNKSIENQIDSFHDKNKVVIDYEIFCNNPEDFYNKICNKLKKRGCEIKSIYNGEKKFNNTNIIKINSDRFKKFIKAYEYFERL